MTDDFQIPDEIEPRVGWRMFRVGRDGSLLHGLLVSMYKTTVVWQPNKAHVASCIYDPNLDAAHVTPEAAESAGKHKAPFVGCRCGAAARSSFPELVVTEGSYIQEGDVCAEVYGWGDVIDGSRGFRAEFAYPKRMWVLWDDGPRDTAISGSPPHSRREQVVEAIAAAARVSAGTLHASVSGSPMSSGSSGLFQMTPMNRDRRTREEAQKLRAELIVNYGVPVGLMRRSRLPYIPKSRGFTVTLAGNSSHLVASMAAMSKKAEEAAADWSAAMARMATMYEPHALDDLLSRMSPRKGILARLDAFCSSGPVAAFGLVGCLAGAVTTSGPGSIFYGLGALLMLHDLQRWWHRR